MSMLLNKSGFTAKKKVLAIALSLVVLSGVAYGAFSYFSSDSVVELAEEIPPSFDFGFEKSDLLGSATIDGCSIPGMEAGNGFNFTDSDDSVELKASSMVVYHSDEDISVGEIFSAIEPVKDNRVMLVAYDPAHNPNSEFSLYSSLGDVDGIRALNEKDVIAANHGFFLLSCQDTKIFNIKDETQPASDFPEDLFYVDGWFLVAGMDALKLSEYDAAVSVYLKESPDPSSFVKKGLDFKFDGRYVMWVKAASAKDEGVDDNDKNDEGGVDENIDELADEDSDDNVNEGSDENTYNFNTGIFDEFDVAIANMKKIASFSLDEQYCDLDEAFRVNLSEAKDLLESADDVIDQLEEDLDAGLLSEEEFDEYVGRLKVLMDDLFNAFDLADEYLDDLELNVCTEDEDNADLGDEFSDDNAVSDDNDSAGMLMNSHGSASVSGDLMENSNSAVVMNPGSDHSGTVVHGFTNNNAFGNSNNAVAFDQDDSGVARLEDFANEYACEIKGIESLAGSALDDLYQAIYDCEKEASSVNYEALSLAMDEASIFANKIKSCESSNLQFLSYEFPREIKRASSVLNSCDVGDVSSGVAGVSAMADVENTGLGNDDLGTSFVGSASDDVNSCDDFSVVLSNPIESYYMGNVFDYDLSFEGVDEGDDVNLVMISGGMVVHNNVHEPVYDAFLGSFPLPVDDDYTFHVTNVSYGFNGVWASFEYGDCSFDLMGME